MIRAMTAGDVNRVVKIHLASFPGFFLSFLGSRFLKLYYSYLCAAANGVCFVYVSSDGVLTGFVAGSLDPRGFYSRLLRRYWLKFIFASFIAISKKPQITRRLMRALYHPSSNPRGSNIAGLYSLAVRPDCQKGGIGKELITSFIEEAWRRGCTNVFLTTDCDNNETANRFYQELGFHIERQYVTPEGRRMNEYWIDLKMPEGSH